METIKAPEPVVVTPPKPTGVTQNGKWNPKIYRGERSYTKNTANTVKDNYTGLIWQKGDDGQQREWKEAQQYCVDLTLDGYSDWRLPIIEELYYLGDVTKHDPAIDTNYFPNIKSNNYWSSTSYKGDSSYAWFIYFNYGLEVWSNKSNNDYVLCVRGQ